MELRKADLLMGRWNCSVMSTAVAMLGVKEAVKTSRQKVRKVNLSILCRARLPTLRIELSGYGCRPFIKVSPEMPELSNASESINIGVYNSWGGKANCSPK